MKYLNLGSKDILTHLFIQKFSDALDAEVNRMKKEDTLTQQQENIKDTAAKIAELGFGPYTQKEQPLKQQAFDPVERPSHYAEGRKYEPIKVIEDWKLSYCLGNALKYISRVGRKEDSLQDLDKAIWYLKKEREQYVNANYEQAFEPKQPIPRECEEGAMPVQCWPFEKPHSGYRTTA